MKTEWGGNEKYLDYTLTIAHTPDIDSDEDGVPDWKEAILISKPNINIFVNEEGEGLVTELDFDIGEFIGNRLQELHTQGEITEENKQQLVNELINQFNLSYQKNRIITPLSSLTLVSHLSGDERLVLRDLFFRGFGTVVYPSKV